MVWWNTIRFFQKILATLGQIQVQISVHSICFTKLLPPTKSTLISLTNFIGYFLSGFIQGVKMSLPIGFERKDDRKFEEITIPAATGSSVDTIIKKLVPIAEFDPIGQTAFRVKVVFWLAR